MPEHGDFSVEPKSLREFAAALDLQADAIRGHKEELDGLGPAAGGTAILGDFPEAGSLEKVHMQALQYMSQLTDQIRELARFAERVAETAAHEYQQHDEEAVATLSNFRINDSSLVGRIV